MQSTCYLLKEIKDYLHLWKTMTQNSQEDNWYIVVEPHSTRDMIEILFKLIVKVLVVGNTANTPNPPGLLPF